MNPDGTFAIGNVPLPTGAFRARAICAIGGVTFTGTGPFVMGTANESNEIGPITFTDSIIIPAALEATASSATLTTGTPTTQVSVQGTLSNGTPVDLTAPDSGTTYLSTNPAIASVDEFPVRAVFSPAGRWLSETYLAAVAKRQLEIPIPNRGLLRSVRG